MKAIHTALGLSFLAAFGLFLAGCETESVDTPIQVSPDAVSLKKGESATFTASGGYDYSWALPSDKLSYGTLSSRTGPTVTYKSEYDPGANKSEVITLTVTSTIQPKAVTNDSATYQATADVYITHVGTAVETNETDDVFVNPANATIVLGQSIGFVAEGGDDVNYAWTLDSTAYGFLSRSTGKDTVYTATKEPTAPTIVYLTATSAGRSFTASITHRTASVEAVTVTPLAPHVDNGGNVTLTAVGGDGNYTWSVNSTANGYLSRTTGPSTTYYATTAAAVTVTVTCQSAGTQFQVAIDQN
jgi:hypothetical protein